MTLKVMRASRGTEMPKGALAFGDDCGDFSYIPKGVIAEGHTPIYKMHKYFARRPQNVVRMLIESYSRPGDVVLDCFCGGGVTLFEGLSIGRKVIAVDLNPLATFISDCQTTHVDLKEYQEIVKQVRTNLLPLIEKYYSTTCRECGSRADVRWFELAYNVECPAYQCRKTTPLSNQNRVVQDGRGRPGHYRCEHCSSPFLAVDAKRIGYRLVSVTYRCKKCPGRRTTMPNSDDESTMLDMERDFESLVRRHGFCFPPDRIPENWDRQSEDCLSRKGIINFSDFFTKRSLFFNAYLLSLFKAYKDKVTPEMYRALLFTFSAVLRYTSNLTISAGSWMDGRPIAWAKHAFWISNQFVEVNPIEYVDKRSKAITTGLKYLRARLWDIKRVERFEDLMHGGGSHIVWTRSSESLPIPDGGVDLVVTDPPYGSNVQYGELSSYWLVWLKDELGIKEDVLSLDQEVVVQRKKRNLRYKGYDYYYNALLQVFSECYRVLKPGGPLVFTFNNKDMKAWYSVVKAATRAGFYLDERGVVYQDSIENYKNTAHARFAGALHGDFIYTFRKLPAQTVTHAIESQVESAEMENLIIEASQRAIESVGQATTNQVYVSALSKLIPYFIKRAESDTDFSRLNDQFAVVQLEKVLRKHFDFDSNTGTWHIPERRFSGKERKTRLEDFTMPKREMILDGRR